MKEKYQTLPILIVLFLSYLGFSMALPIFPSLFLGQNSSSIISKDLSLEMRTIILGALTATYPLGQFFGGPFLGKLSDSYGRKKVLIYSLILTIPTYIASGVAILYSNLPLLFASRLFCGLFEGNSVIVSASMADISEDTKQKVRNFGWVMGISSLGFVFGPYFGGKFSAEHEFSKIGYETPFFIAAVLVAIGLTFVIWIFQETLHISLRKEFAFLKTIKSLFSSLYHPKYRSLFSSNFSLYCSFFFFFGFFPVLLVSWDGYSASQVGEIISYLSIPICLSPLLYNYISKIFSPLNAIISSALLLVVCLILLIVVPKLFYFWLIPIGFAIAVSWTYTSVILSDKAAANEQGSILGANQAITILSEIFASLFGGLAASFRIDLPLILAAMSALMSASIFFLVIKKRS
jgi:DHA1 family tetracycline resistance protein-like MFS transporter